MDGLGWDGKEADTETKYKRIVHENIEYDVFLTDPKVDRKRLDEIVDLIVETLRSAKPTINVSDEVHPASLVKGRLMKLTFAHIEYVYQCLDKNTTHIRNIKKYLLTALFNAPSTIECYYAAQINHEMSRDGLVG